VEYILRSLYGDAPAAACEEQAGCGACLSCEVFGHRGGRGRLAFRDSPIADAPTPVERTQVGIDRVTGGSCDGLLYTVAPVTGGRLTLRIDALDDVPPWVRPAVLHVLRDLDDGLIGIGSRVTRGMGTLRLATDIPPPPPVEVAGLSRSGATP
jgi:hypothetical protein